MAILHRRSPLFEGRRAPNVLLVDDDPDVLICLKSAVEKLGASPLCLSSGVEAWQAIQEHDGLLVAVLNWLLPDLDGHVIAARLRERTPMVTVLMLGRGLIPDVWERMSLTADFLVAKPLGRDGTGQICGIVEAAFRNRVDRIVSGFTKN